MSDTAESEPGNLEKWWKSLGLEQDFQASFTLWFAVEELCNLGGSYLTSLSLMSNMRLRISWFIIIPLCIILNSNPKSVYYWMYWPWRSWNLIKQAKILKIESFERVAKSNVSLTLQWMVHPLQSEILLQRTLWFCLFIFALLCLPQQPHIPDLVSPGRALESSLRKVVRGNVNSSGAGVYSMALTALPWEPLANGLVYRAQVYLTEH